MEQHLAWKSTMGVNTYEGTVISNNSLCPDILQPIICKGSSVCLVATISSTMSLRPILMAIATYGAFGHKVQQMLCFPINSTGITTLKFLFRYASLLFLIDKEPFLPHNVIMNF